MYCAQCGFEIGEKLNYCNKCGAKLVRAEESRSVRTPVIVPVVALTLITVCGLGILAGLTAILLGHGVPFDQVILTVALYLIALVSICYLLLRPFSKMISNSSEKSFTSSDEVRQPKLEGFRPAALGEARQSFVSVTEDTTRTLDKVLADRE